MWKKRWAPKQVWRFWELSLMKLDDIHSSGILKSWMDLNPSRILQKAPLELVSLAVLKWCVLTSHRVDSKIQRKLINIYKEVLYSIHSSKKNMSHAICHNCQRKFRKKKNTQAPKRTNSLNSPDPKWTTCTNGPFGRGISIPPSGRFKAARCAGEVAAPGKNRGSSKGEATFPLKGANGIYTSLKLTYSWWKTSQFIRENICSNIRKRGKTHISFLNFLEVILSYSYGRWKKSSTSW